MYQSIDMVYLSTLECIKVHFGMYQSIESIRSSKRLKRLFCHDYVKFDLCQNVAVKVWFQLLSIVIVGPEKG